MCKYGYDTILRGVTMTKANTVCIFPQLFEQLKYFEQQQRTAIKNNAILVTINIMYTNRLD